MELIYITALSVGFFGSFHCIGMCGPLALAIPKTGNTKSSFLVGRLLYNFGRIITYTILGLIVGLLGRSISFNGLQGDISILSGILIILFVIFSNDGIVKKINSKLVNSTFQLKKHLGLLLKKHSYSSLISIGILNGVLPCGFVYLSLAGAASTSSIIGGAFYMFLFGLGTLPMMLILSLSGVMISNKVKGIINRFSPVIAIALALFLINRGTSLRSEKADCCNKNHKITTLK